MSQPDPSHPDSNALPSSAPPPAGSPTGIPDPNERTWCIACHLSGLLGFLGPLVVWLLKRHQWNSVDVQGRESLNFQLTVLIAYVLFLFGSYLTCGITALLLPVVYVASIVLVVIASVKSSNGEDYRYPLTWRLV